MLTWPHWRYIQQHCGCPHQQSKSAKQRTHRRLRKQRVRLRWDVTKNIMTSSWQKTNYNNQIKALKWPPLHEPPGEVGGLHFASRRVILLFISAEEINLEAVRWHKRQPDVSPLSALIVAREIDSNPRGYADNKVIERHFLHPFSTQTSSEDKRRCHSWR